MKRILCLSVIAAILLSLVPITAGAETYNDLTYIKYSDHIKITHCDPDAVSVDIPAEIDGLPVTEIGEGAFLWGCISLTSVTIPDSVISIGDEAFADCGRLTSVTIGNGVTSIGESVFADCTGLTSITIGTGVTSIDEGAFVDTAYYNDESNWQNGVLYIGDCLIKANIDLPSDYTIKNGTRVIADYAFDWCDSLMSVTIPSGVTNIGNFAFSSCGLTSITVDNQNQYYCSIDGNLFDKDKKTLIQYAIGKQDSKYTIPSGVTRIGNGAFVDCESLKSVTIPSSVKSIGYGAFNGCESLKSITIPSSVTSIGNGAFYYTAYYNDKSNWQDGVLYIDNCLIGANGELPSDYTIKNATRVIADSAFAFCDSLTSVTIPSGVTSIGEGVFYGCYDLTSVTIPDSVTSIGYEAFEECWSLTSVTIPNSVTSIGDYAFSSCGLTSVTIPDSVTSIGDYAFSNCSLTSATIPDSVTSIGDYAFSSCGLTSVTIPDSVTSIGDWAFAFCESLTDITLGNGITSIGAWEFEGCWSLTSVTIPDSVTSIAAWAFADCGLTSVYYGGREADWQRIYIGDYNENLTGATIHYNSVIDTEPTKFASMPTVSAGGNEEYTVSVSLQDIDTDCVMVAVIYDGKTLTGASAVELSEGQTEASASVSAEQADTAKVFIWDSIDSMKPLCHPQAVNIR